MGIPKERVLLQDYKKKLDNVGCGFCLAKWTQVTIHLQLGETHSCHHPNTHKISPIEIKRNPSALHNTKFKKEKRKEMLEGKRPAECDYCWNVEDNSDQLSDRVFKSNESWSKPHFDEIKNLNWREDYNPKYVEVAFSNACNFKCSYCGPSFSSSWLTELKNHGHYPTTDRFNDIEYLQANDKLPIPHNQENPYVEAFWKWWPDLYRDLHTFRITGGEPLMSPDTWKVLDYLISEPEPNRKLKLGINSNLGVPDQLIDKLIEKLQQIEADNIVQELIIYTSCDTAGENAQYIRNGLDYKKWQENCHKILSQTKRTSMVIMSTFNALSIARYKEFMMFGYELKTKYNGPDRYWNPVAMIDSSYLRFPRHQAVNILPEEWADKVEEIADWAEDLRMLNKPREEEWQIWHMGFTDIEITKLRRVADWMRAPQDRNQQRINRANFYRFFSEHDRRRGTDFLNECPQYAEFWYMCKRIAEDTDVV